ncbi:nickel ABC transporter permease [Pseudoleptotrichia goodfellowii]|uniref:ABC transporter, permease protein n=1 Tax=Pseudoleptotrichia goodfellowii F0264 TaxID=596323 RepID=D0GPE9_9FUSO|nr:nickel ABC transporter permease [Pseudoleptotrichia goodfellowii]EEY34030.1 ABC transporter, permease protein [Pseudoleptotrichia goodfellowii F0264]
MKNKKLLKYIIQILIVLFGISFFTFCLVYISPGDPAETMLTECGNIPTPELLAQTRAELGLDKPFYIQYGRWLFSVLRGDFRKSYSLRIPVIQKIASAFMPTLSLAFLALFLMCIISIPLGILAAIKENKWQDYLVRMMTFMGMSVPSFWLGLIFLSVFGVTLKLVSVSGGKADFRSIILPAFTIAIAMSAKYTRQIRHIFLEELNKSYVTGARMRGIKENVILWRHVLPNAMLPIITLLGLSLGSLLGGTAVVEIIYNWPGMGSMAVKAITFSDYSLIQAYVLIIAFLYLIVNITVDISYKYLDARVEEVI